MKNYNKYTYRVDRRPSGIKDDSWSRITGLALDAVFPSKIEIALPEIRTLDKHNAGVRLGFPSSHRPKKFKKISSNFWRRFVVIKEIENKNPYQETEERPNDWLAPTPGSTKEYMKVMGDFSPYTEAKEYAKRLPKQSHVKKRDLFPAKIGQWFKDMQAKKKRAKRRKHRGGGGKLKTKGKSSAGQLARTVHMNPSIKQQMKAA